MYEIVQSFTFHDVSIYLIIISFKLMIKLINYLLNHKKAAASRSLGSNATGAGEPKSSEVATGDLEDQPGVDKRGTITAFMTRRVDEGSDVAVESAAGSSLAAVPVESAAEPLDAAEPSAKKRGRPAKAKASAREIELEREARQLKKRLAKAETIIAFQKKVHELLEIPLNLEELDDND